jgi:hypothetical protein
MAGPLHGRRQAALMFRAGSSLPARADAAMFGDVATQRLHILIVNLVNFIHTERADTAAAETPCGPAASTKFTHVFLQSIDVTDEPSGHLIRRCALRRLSPYCWFCAALKPAAQLCFPSEHSRQHQTLFSRYRYQLILFAHYQVA